jgi:predicted deacetylase
MAKKAILSVHDLMPNRVRGVRRILELLRAAGAPPCTLLVVPGSGWEAEGIEWLKALEGRGHRLAAHGWSHQAPEPASLYHRLHGALISRDQGEHLSRPRRELLELMEASFCWFSEVGLRQPGLYVPPAWALGKLTRNDLVSLPFRQYEILGGLLDGRTGRLTPLPLVGFEADTWPRKVALKVFNSANLGVARLMGWPVRISIHPEDVDYLLGRDLDLLVRAPLEFMAEEELLGHPQSKS